MDEQVYDVRSRRALIAVRDELVRQDADNPAADDHVTDGVERSLAIDRVG